MPDCTQLLLPAASSLDPCYLHCPVSSNGEPSRIFQGEEKEGAAKKEIGHNGDGAKRGWGVGVVLKPRKAERIELSTAWLICNCRQTRLWDNTLLVRFHVHVQVFGCYNIDIITARSRKFRVQYPTQKQNKQTKSRKRREYETPTTQCINPSYLGYRNVVNKYLGYRNVINHKQAWLLKKVPLTACRKDEITR